MTYKKIGPIEIITGERDSKVPFSTTLLIEGEDETALIDCGGGSAAFQYIHENYQIQNIYLTHYHIDHVWGAHFFENADIHINNCDYNKLNDIFELAKASGIYALYGEDGAKQWLAKTLQTETSKDRSFNNIIGLAKQTYPYDKEIEIAGEKAVMIHTPGHCESYCSPYFPEHGILYVGDFDLTSFGPWYNNADSDIDLFIESAYKTLEIDADYFITAHQKGMFNKTEYKQKLQDYLAIIDRRENQVKTAIKKGVLPKDIVHEEVFYFRKNHRKNPSLMDSEIIGIAKHIQRLINQGENLQDYYRDFISYFQLHENFLNFSSKY